MKNIQIRLEAARYRIKLWEIASELGITDSTLSRKLRQELPEEDQQRILEIISRLSREGVAT